MSNQIIEKIGIVLRLSQADEVLLQDPKQVNLDGMRAYEFSDEERKIKVIVKLQKYTNAIVGSIQFLIENHPFWENQTLASYKPITIKLDLGSTPQNILAKYMFNDWWTRPTFANSLEEIPDRTQSLILKNEDNIQYILPLVGEKFKTYITGGHNTEVHLKMTGFVEGINKLDDELSFIITTGQTVTEAIKEAFKIGARLKEIPLRKERKYPEVFDYIGWCSWDAFYTDINEQRVREKVNELREKEIPVGWILMDDGWLSVDKQCLSAFEPDKEKFPHGFKEMIREIKDTTSVKWVGVWHALAGYWGGIAMDSALSNKYKNNLYHTLNDKLIPHFIPEKGYGFWNDWYNQLKKQGIDFVKVDGQSALKNYYASNETIGKVVEGTHQGIEGAVGNYFEGRIINCMGMATESMWSRPSSSISRNSDDFVPQNENGFVEHLLQNAYNGLYHNELYYCDWDMYWTSHKDATKHALLRAISGGPIYFSDQIGQTNKREIEPLIYRDGKILRMERCAKVTEDCVFIDPTKEGAMKLSNVLHKTGTIGIFNINAEGKKVETIISPKDVEELEEGNFGVFNYFEKSFCYLSQNESITVSLEPEAYGLIHFIPRGKDITPIGFLDKYISYHPVEQFEEIGEGAVIRLREGGVFGFATDKVPKSILVNGIEYIEKLKKEKNYFTIDLAKFAIEINLLITF